MQASGALRGVRQGAPHVEGGAERFFRDGRPLSFSGASLSSGGPTFVSRVGRMNGSFGEFAEFPEDDWTAVNFDHCWSFSLLLGPFQWGSLWQSCRRPSRPCSRTEGPADRREEVPHVT